jgi:hypothetical protein
MTGDFTLYRCREDACEYETSDLEHAKDHARDNGHWAFEKIPCIRFEVIFDE